MSDFARVAAIIVALCAWGGLGLQYWDVRLITETWLGALWVLLMYFTITTNLLVALTFTSIGLGRDTHPRVLGGVMVAMVLVGAAYHLLLRDLPLGNSPTAWLSNFMVHTVSPVLVVIFWIAFVPKGHLQWSDAAAWAAYPLGYLGYALVRGHFTGRYPYPFINVAEIGMAASLRNAAGIALCFILFSLALIGVDHGRQTT